MTSVVCGKVWVSHILRTILEMMWYNGRDWVTKDKKEKQKRNTINQDAADQLVQERVFENWFQENHYGNGVGTSRCVLVS